MRITGRFDQRSYTETINKEKAIMNKCPESGSRKEQEGKRKNFFFF